mmetsp:Transcript_31858/g.58064  ORF Transcript_31858/g.58064 Transcript_31858/m.58064 type:complete len:90 (-) Transcript_31858:499-768(-)
MTASRRREQRRSMKPSEPEALKNLFLILKKKADSGQKQMISRSSRRGEGSERPSSIYMIGYGQFLQLVACAPEREQLRHANEKRDFTLT